MNFRKRFVLTLMLIAFLSMIIGCEVEDSETGSVFEDHQGVPYDDGSDLSDIMDGNDFYFGTLHSHTNNSDGEGSPAEAFAFARDVAGLDFYAVTDHAEQLSSSEWNDTGVQADYYTQNGSFVAIRGFEWSQVNGHICVWNTEGYTSAILSLHLSEFYEWLDSNNGLAHFNHPGREGSVFKDFSYNSDVTDNMLGVETGNKGSGNIDGEYLAYYSSALAKGWRLAPYNEQDNHSLSINRHRTVIIADQLTRNSLFDAMTARRVYSSDDPNMKVVFKIGVHWMGEVVNITAGSYEAIVRVEDDEPITKLEITDSYSSVIASKTVSGDLTSVEWHPVIDVNSNEYYFLTVYEDDTMNDELLSTEQISVTAPIWLNVQ